MIIQHESMNESLGNLKVATNKEYEDFLKALLKYRRKDNPYSGGHSISSNSKVIEMQGVGKDNLTKDLRAKDENGKALRAVYIVSENGTAFILNLNTSKTLGVNSPVEIASYKYTSTRDRDEGPQLSMGRIIFDDRAHEGVNSKKLTVKSVVDMYKGLDMRSDTQYKAIGIFDDPAAAMAASDRYDRRIKSVSDRYEPQGYKNETEFMRDAKIRAAEMRSAKGATINTSVESVTVPMIYLALTNKDEFMVVDGERTKIITRQAYRDEYPVKYSGNSIRLIEGYEYGLWLDVASGKIRKVAK